MLELQMPWNAAPVQRASTRRWLRGLAHLIQRSLPLHLDPSYALLHPGPWATHRVTRLTIPLGDHATPGHLFMPNQASGATVVLVHGTSAEKTLPYFMWIRALLDAGLNVMTFELDGHGDNPRPLALPQIDENVPAALAVLRARPEIDPTRIGLLGVSLGGACALNAAPGAEGVKAVVTVSAPHRMVVDEWDALSEAAGLLNPETMGTYFEASPNRLVSFTIAPMRFASGEVEPDLLDPATAAMVNRALRHLNPLDNAAKLETPLLVINGEWDNITPPWQARDLYNRAAGPKALAMIPRRNHMTVMISRTAVEAGVHWFRRYL